MIQENEIGATVALGTFIALYVYTIYYEYRIVKQNIPTGDELLQAYIKMETIRRRCGRY